MFFSAPHDVSGHVVGNSSNDTYCLCSDAVPLVSLVTRTHHLIPRLVAPLSELPDPPRSQRQG